MEPIRHFGHGAQFPPCPIATVCVRVYMPLARQAMHATMPAPLYSRHYCTEIMAVELGFFFSRSLLSRGRLSYARGLSPAPVDAVIVVTTFPRAATAPELGFLMAPSGMKTLWRPRRKARQGRDPLNLSATPSFLSSLFLVSYADSCWNKTRRKLFFFAAKQEASD